MSDIQDAKYRDAEIERANRDRKVAKMFFDERQRLLFHQMPSKLIFQ